MDGDAPNLLLPDPNNPGQPVQLAFKGKPFDAEIGHSRFLGERNLLTHGGNRGRNTLDITIAPMAPDRLELGPYLQHEIPLRAGPPRPRGPSRQVRQPVHAVLLPARAVDT